MKKVRKIDIPKEIEIKKKLRVAAYCRVSTKYESQRSSIELQIRFYTEYIKSNTEWIFAGVYIDYGSRCRVKGCNAFQEMYEKALKGKIDFIITKSISRFSGNTVDMLVAIRNLKEKNVTVWFEKEDIRSTGENVEQMITLYTALAQEEVRNMRENIKWGFEQRFQQGITLNNYKDFYGFDVIDGELVVNEKQAQVVKNIFEWYLKGMSLRQIRHKLEEMNIKTATGKDIWHEKVIMGMLTNEKYMGDSILQKYYTKNFLDGKRFRNNGEINRYYVYDSHQGIISKEMFLETMCEMNRRKKKSIGVDGTLKSDNKKYNAQNVLGNIWVCEVCGASFRRRTERGKVKYRCATRMEKGKDACKNSPTLDEEWIKDELGRKVCGGIYDEKIVRKKVERVYVSANGSIKVINNNSV